MPFTVEESKAQRGKVTCPTQTNGKWYSQDLNPRSLTVAPWLTSLYTLPNWLILGISFVFATTLETELEALLSKDQFGLLPV